MKCTLYPCFKHWYHGGQIYFYSDPHFNDEESKYVRLNNIDDEQQIKNINSKISQRDTLIILGDIGDIECVKKLRGYKVLILGNHDRGASYYELVFNEVYNGALLINNKILLSHEPIEYQYAFNIHGHDHSNTFRSPKHKNVCAEHINYTPISLKDIVNSGALKNIPDIHREAIDKQVKKNRKKKEEKDG
jgi:calcineurin-like phosphoesterase family protein